MISLENFVRKAVLAAMKQAGETYNFPTHRISKHQCVRKKHRLSKRERKQRKQRRFASRKSR